MKKSRLWLAAGFYFYSAIVCANAINICSDENLWYPFSFQKEGVAKGLHIDIVKQVLRQLGYKATITPFPWKRCLHYAEIGKVDAVINASYKKSRAEFMHYPPDAASAKESDWRVTQVEYVVASYHTDPYVFRGDVKTLPAPIWAPYGYSIVDDLKKEGVKAYTLYSEIENMRRLVKLKKGAALTLAQVVKFLNNREEFKGKIKIHPTPLKSKSYFMTFSKKSTITAEKRMEIWNEIARVREDDGLMQPLLLRY